MNSVFIKSDRRTCFIIGAPIRFFPDETFGLKSKSHHRGMKFGIALHLIRNWVQALPAGGPEETRTLYLYVANVALSQVSYRPIKRFPLRKLHLRNSFLLYSILCHLSRAIANKFILLFHFLPGYRFYPENIFKNLEYLLTFLENMI